MVRGKADIQRLYALVTPYFRRRRARLFRRLFPTDAATRILDVGGYHYDWAVIETDARVTCLNRGPTFPSVPATPAGGASQFTYVCGDGRSLDYADGAFDIGFSNSVIEHVGGKADQARFAAEIQRVCKGIFVQTPNRWFFVEPHLLAPFIHFLPKARQYGLVRWLTLWGLVYKPTPEQVRQQLDSTRLLTRREMREIFPSCQIHVERFLWIFAKSFVAHRSRRDPP